MTSHLTHIVPVPPPDLARVDRAHDPLLRVPEVGEAEVRVALVHRGAPAAPENGSWFMSTGERSKTH